MKNRSLVLLILLAALGAMYYAKYVSKSGSQMALARETHKAMDAMMADLRDAHFATVKGVPSDGKWYHSVSFEKTAEGVVAYEATPASHELRRSAAGSSRTVAGHIAELNIRRQPGSDSMQRLLESIHELLAFARAFSPLRPNRHDRPRRS